MELKSRVETVLPTVVETLWSSGGPISDFAGGLRVQGGLVPGLPMWLEAMIHSWLTANISTPTTQHLSPKLVKTMVISCSLFSRYISHQYSGL